MSYLTEKKAEPSSNNKKYKRWSKEETSNGITKSVRIEEVSNGYIITYCKYGTDESNPEAGYINEEIKKISKVNPFEKEESDDNDSDDSKNSFDGLMSSATNSLNSFI